MKKKELNEKKKNEAPQKNSMKETLSKFLIPS